MPALPRQHGLFILTGLVPTEGHRFAIETAAEVMELNFGKLHVIVFDRTFEPVKGTIRASAIREQFAHMPWVHVYHHVDDGAPQNDDGTQEFWNYWCNLAERVTGVDNFSFVFASEAYGNTYANHLGGRFIPIDIDREINNIKGTTVRRNLHSQFGYVMPSFRKHLARRIVMFGAESTGKTTMAKQLVKNDNIYGQSKFLPEWARPYLERFGPDVTDERMENIAMTQYAIEKAALRNLEVPWVYQDTDLLSTIGYYRIYKGQPYKYIDQMFEETKGHLYIVMSSGIKFTEDPLRYGGKVRESTDQFWIDLLEEYKCNYYVVQSHGESWEQQAEIEKVIRQFKSETFRELAEFERD